MRKVIQAICVVLLLGLWVPAAPAQESVEANLEVMSRLSSEIAEELITGFPPGLKPEHIALIPYGQDETYEFMTNVFARILTERGFRTLTPNNPETGGGGVGAANGGFRMEYQALNFALVYPRIYRPYLFGGRQVKRRADLRIMARLVDGKDDSVVWVGEAVRSHEDQFSFSHISQVEAGLFEFNKPPHDTTAWGKIVEPVVVSGIIVGLIYLFFSNQTDE